MSETKIPVWFWIVVVIALLWNGMGVFNYLVQTTMTENLDEVTRAYVESRPAWVTAGFAIAVWGGLVASVFLVIRKSVAYITFVISFIGVMISTIHSVFMSDIEIEGANAGLSITIVLVSLLLIFVARHANNKGWAN